MSSGGDAIVLPHVVAYNAGAASKVISRVARAMGASDPATGLYDLTHALGAAVALASIRLAAGDLDRAASLAMAQAYPSPGVIERVTVRALLDNAYHRVRPNTVSGTQEAAA